MAGFLECSLFQIAGVALDVRAPHREQPKLVRLAPGDELPQVEGVRVAGEAAVAGEKRGKRYRSASEN